MIPRIIHQTWKTKDVPKQWMHLQQKVIFLHPDWEYRLWTDKDCDTFVKREFPDFYSIYNSFPKNMMRADAIRYLIMYRIGGLYLDLDYELLSRFDPKDAKLILPKNRSKFWGDSSDGIGTAIFASEPGQRFWKDVIDELKSSAGSYDSNVDVVGTTGPKFLTRVFYGGNYSEIEVPERLVFHPPTPRTKEQYQDILDNGVSRGIHHVWGSWRERSRRDRLTHFTLMMKIGRMIKGHAKATSSDESKIE
jgi:mannosyltransferase OCH1-like enzyme